MQSDSLTVGKSQRERLVESVSHHVSGNHTIDAGERFDGECYRGEILIHNYYDY